MEKAGSSPAQAGRPAKKRRVGNDDVWGRWTDCEDAENYLEAWFSPRRLRRSRRRRCSGVGVLGLKATRYQRGWLRSLLSQVSVGASALGWRATFSRMAA